MACQPVPIQTIIDQITETGASTSTRVISDITTIPDRTVTEVRCIPGPTDAEPSGGDNAGGPTGGGTGSGTGTGTGSPSPVTKRQACDGTPTTITSIIPGSTISRIETITTVVPSTSIRSAPRTTIFSQCPQDPGPGPDTSRPTTPSPTPRPPSPTPTPTPRQPTPTVRTRSTTTTLPNGSLTVLVSYITTTASYTSSSEPSPTAASGKPANIGAIVGGSIGGFLGILAIIIGIVCWRRSKRWDDIFEKDIGHTISDGDNSTITPQMQPSPYHYGMVGAPLPNQSGGNSPVLGPLRNPHSRMSSFGGSAYSGESSAPLVHPFADPNAAYGGMYVGRPASYPPVLAPMHYQPAPSPPPDRPMSEISSTISSLTPSQSAGVFYVANASAEEGYMPMSRPLSEVSQPPNGAYQAPLQPMHLPMMSEKQLYQQQQQQQPDVVADVSNQAGSSQSGPSIVPVMHNEGRMDSEAHGMGADAPPAYQQ